MAGQAREATDLRALKALVAVLGVLIVLGTALVVGVVIHRIYARTAEPSNVAGPAEPSTYLGPAEPSTYLGPAEPSNVAGPAAVSAMGAVAPAVLGKGEHVAGMAAAGADVAVWVTGPAGDRVLLLDPRTGAVTVALTAPK
jgi:hypothetical protein